MKKNIIRNIYSLKYSFSIKVLAVFMLNLLFYRCIDNQHERQNQEFLESSYLKFAERTDKMFGVGCYPLYAPFKEGECHGFQIYFNRDINIKDTIKGTLEIYDSNELKIDYTFSGGDFKYDVINGEGKKDKIVLVPKSEGIIGYYIYRFIFKEENEAEKVNLITTDNDTITLYQKGDEILIPVENKCY